METVPSSGKVAVELNPVPGFCVKSRATSDALIQHLTASECPSNLTVKQNTKVFVNVAWDPNIPPPPHGSDDVIRRAMHSSEIDQANREEWLVPVVLSDVRQDSDKAGQPSIVFDCVFHQSIKSRCLKDPEFKSFIIELAFQHIEAQTSLILSRQIGTPNIASKGRPRSRRVLVAAALYPSGHPNHQAPPPLIQEIPKRSTGVPDKVQPKGILKKSAIRIPAWSWTQQGSRIRIVFDVPDITHAVIPECTLDVEPRRVLLHVPGLYCFDLNLDAPDSELSFVFGRNETADQALRLKLVHGLDVDNAKAEWRVVDRTIVLLA